MRLLLLLFFHPSLLSGRVVLLVLLEVLCEEVHGVGGTLLGQRGQGLQQDRHDGLELTLISYLHLQ